MLQFHFCLLCTYTITQVFFISFLNAILCQRNHFLRQSIKNTQNIIHSKGNVMWYRIRYKEPVGRWNWRTTSPCAPQLAVKHYLNHKPLEKKKTAVSGQFNFISGDWYLKYVNQVDILSDFRSSFRHSYSTRTYLSYRSIEKDTIKKESDNGKSCGMAMLDLQNAFDTANHQILGYQLKVAGFNKEALKWIQ